MAFLRLPALPEARLGMPEAGLGMQAMPSLTPAARLFWVEPVQAFLARTEAALGQDCEALTDGGRDRMFVAASACLSRSCRVLAQAYCKVEANKQVPESGWHPRPAVWIWLTGCVAAMAVSREQAPWLLAWVLEPA